MAANHADRTVVPQAQHRHRPESRSVA